MKTGNYKEAAKNFEIALDSMPGSKLAVTGLRAARLAPQWKEAGSQYTVKRENFFNSRRADYSPMLSGDDNDQLFFTSTRNQVKGDELSGITGTKNGDIFFSQKDEKGKWTKPEDIDTELNSSFDEGACSFTPDGKTMYLTQCLTDPSYPRYATICTSERSDAAWGRQLRLQSPKTHCRAMPIRQCLPTVSGFISRATCRGNGRSRHLAGASHDERTWGSGEPWGTGEYRG